MTFRQFAIHNVVRNKRLYAAYFLSSLFTVMVFFTFAIFAFHPTLINGSIRGEALFGMAVAGSIIYVFSFFFVLYSMSSFLQSRKREFGLLMMQGMSTRQIRLMVFLENMLIGFFATVFGIVLGLIFSKAILLLAENVLVIGESLDFYFPLLAIVVTFVSFIVLFFCISLVVSFILRTNKLIDLIKGGQQSKGEPKASKFLGFLAVALLLAGYGTALYVKGMQVILAMLPVIAVVVLGTYLFFTQLSVAVIRRLKNSKRIFWRKTNMVLLSDLSFRMKDNARTFFMVAIISTVAFSAIGALYGFQSYITRGIGEVDAFTFSYTSDEDQKDDEVQGDIRTIKNVMNQYDIQASSEAIDMHYFDQNDDQVLIASESDYNRFAALTDEEKIHVQDDEAIVVEDSNKVLTGDDYGNRLMNVPVKLSNGETIQPNRMIESNVLPEMLSYYVVSDDAYEELPSAVDENKTTAWVADSGQKDAVIDAGEEIFKQIDASHVTAIDFTIHQINKIYGPILFIGLFIGIVFFVSAGSFLYFRLYTDLDDDKEKFKAIAKMGLTDKEMKKVINRQTALLFFAPIVVAVIHGAVALTALSHFFEYNLMKEATFVLGGFALIQIVYFGIVRYFYIKQIRAAIR